MQTDNKKRIKKLIKRIKALPEDTQNRFLRIYERFPLEELEGIEWDWNYREEQTAPKGEKLH